MSQSARAAAVPAINSQSLYKLQTHFIAPEIQQRDDVAVRQSKLARIVADDIVPRLLHLHTEVVSDAPPVAVVIEALAPSRADVSALADIVLGTNLDAAAAYVMMLRDRGLTMETLFISLLEPTARHLGEMWDKDECDFVDVTLGVARLQKLLAVFNQTYEEPELETRRHVLMATISGDQHSFGVTMVQKFLRASGWRVQAEFSTTMAEIVNAARRNWFAVAGLAAGSERQLDTLALLIGQIREQSQNPAIGIMVGGPMFTADPALAAKVGADATASTAPGAVLVAQKLFDLAAPNLRVQSKR